MVRVMTTKPETENAPVTEADREAAKATASLFEMQVDDWAEQHIAQALANARAREREKAAGYLERVAKERRDLGYEDDARLLEGVTDDVRKGDGL